MPNLALSANLSIMRKRWIVLAGIILLVAAVAGVLSNKRSDATLLIQNVEALASGEVPPSDCVENMGKCWVYGTVFEGLSLP